MLGAEHLLTAETLHQLARCFQEQKQLRQARVLDAQEQTHCLATLPLLAHPPCADQVPAPEQQDEAEDMYQRVLAIRSKALGPDHPAVQAVIQEYAHLLRCGHREGEAQALFEEQRASQA
jgi:hypothetical protein